jgi:hypothetical protein
VRVEELIIEVDNGRNVVLVRVAVPRGAHIGKWLNRLHAGREDSFLKAPYNGRRRAAGGGLGWCRGAMEGGASVFGGWGGKWTPVVPVAAPAMERRTSASDMATQGGGVGEIARCLYRLGPGRTRGTRGRTHGLSRPTHFGPKSETGMSARGRVRTVLSVWVAPLDRMLCPCGHVGPRVII